MRQILPLTSIFIFLFLNSFAQNIDSTIEKYGNDYGQEKTYLHYDKSTYATGETIWYKAYIMNGINAADESKTFYVDWTDDKGKLLSHSVIPVVYATAAGQFDIPADYTGKYIHVKAYTKWMLNFDSSFLYNKDIRILSKANNSSALKSTTIPSLQFFPEGGDAVKGVVNKIAFKANDQWGHPIKIKGIVQDNNGVKIDSLRTIHDGMGYFYIFPKAGESFTAKWKDQKGTVHVSELPAIKQTGVSLQVTIAGNKRNFVVSATPDIAASLGNIHVLGTMNQHEVFKLTKDFSQGNIKGIIPAEDLPSGILTITVFDEHWSPLAERITYINNQEYTFNAEMNVEHWGLNKRARDEVSITVPDSLAASFSIAVTDIGIDTDSSDNIISHLLLTGDLKGQVYNPAYYFSNNSDTISQQLDLVMLTHGWRRFKWEEVTAGKFPKIIYPRDTSYLSLSGKIYGAMPSQLRDAGSIVLIMQKQKHENKMVVVPIEPNGTFHDPSVILFDTSNIFYQLPKAKGLGDASVQFMENRLPPFSNNIAANGLFNNQLQDTAGDSRHLLFADEEKRLANLYKAKVLEAVTVQAKTKKPLDVLDEKYTSGLFSGGDAYQFDLLNDPSAVGSMNIFNYLQGKVAGLQITTGSPPSLQWRGGTPQIYLDEVPADADMISSLSITDVAYVKVLRPPFIGGTGGGGSGAIAIYTRRGNDKAMQPGKGLSNNTVRGYTSMREFYSPNYGTINENDDKKDIRSTLYWNPQVLTNRDNNKVTVTFYNNDISQAFHVVIEGMSSDGRLVHIENTME
ncbi:hypothetical protein FW778_18895 [Ginsengibacter hankyongi]|uniref:TonB-dependent receptor plug domain-containing protein n=1 Tax=Ginsengibacter hankyongi TaxID=2607284 RepID=A0A5J5IDE5_9BACT|nr:hypothetical protein [Ginsengibacter hankyongi]KAA9036305.1 hypothetical protein FW778_18895 [Ginsengibacter hankyongi]